MGHEWSVDECLAGLYNVSRVNQEPFTVGYQVFAFDPREKFEMARAKWRERKKMAYIRKLRKDRLKEAKRKQKAWEKRKLEKQHMGRAGHKRRKAARKEQEAAEEKAKEEGIELKGATINRHLKARRAKPHG